MLENDISIIFQGPYNNNLNNSITKIKSIFPSCEIIISSWKDDIKYFDIKEDVKMVFSDDPGPDFIDCITKAPDNFTRQWYSTLTGLTNATKKYSIKLRTDVILENNIIKILELIEKLEKLNKKYAVCTAGSIDPRKFPILLHFSDLIQVGKTKDLITLWKNSSRGTICEDIHSLIFRKTFFGLSGFRYAFNACEQRLWISNDDKVSIDSFNKYLVKKHNDYQKKILLFRTENVGIVLPSRIYEDSRSYKYFYTNRIEKITYSGWIFTRFNIKFYKSYIKSFFSFLFYLFPFLMRLLKK